MRWPWQPRGGHGEQPGSRFRLVWKPEAGGIAQGGPRCCEDDGKRSEGRSLTGDHLLGVVRLHVAVVLPESLSLPRLSALLSIEGVRVILHNHHLHEEMRFYQTPVQFLGLSIGC